MAGDFYETLGVQRDASANEIKRAYRDLAKRYHPDRNQGDKEAERKFKQLSQAYDVLSHEEQRAAYDRFGHQAFEAGLGSGGASGAGSFGGGFASSMSDIFDDLFQGFTGGGRQTRQHSSRGEDIRYDIEINLEESAKGLVKDITLHVDESCASCSGSGAAKGSQNINCIHCGGRGVIQQQSGFFALQRTCPHCGGMGWLMSNPCAPCSGQGRKQGKQRLRIKIPAGIRDGAQMRLTGKGSAGFRSGAPGDLFVFIHIARHRFFEREGNNLFCFVPVPMVVAALGGEVSVPMLGGEQVSVKIPEGCQTGKRLRVRGKGICDLHDSRMGDLFIDVQVETPVHLDEQQKKLLESFRDSLTEKNAPKTSGFAKMIHNFFNKLRS